MRHKILFFLLFNVSLFSQIQTNTLETGFFGPFIPQQNVLWNSIQTKKEAFDKKIQKEYDLIKDCPNKTNLDTLNGKLIYEELINNTIKANKASRFDALGHDYINEQIAKYINGIKSFGSVIISEIGGFANMTRDYFKNFKDNFREVGGVHAIDEHAEDVTAVMIGGDPTKFQRGVFVGKNVNNNVIGQYSVSGGIGSLRDYKEELKKDPSKFFAINCSWGAPFQWTVTQGIPYWRGGFNGDDYLDRLKDISYKEKEYNQFSYLNNNQAVLLFAAGNHGHRGSEEIDSKIQLGSDIYVDDQNGKKIKIPYGSNGVLYPKPSQINGSINSYAGGKNLITVGATSMLNDAGNYSVTEYTSIGPTTDGRIKPDICAEGQTIDFNFQKEEGTSFATPLVSSIVSAFSEEYKINNGQYPTATTIKASLINSALDIGDPGPDYMSGWGQCNGEELFRYAAKNALVIQDVKTLRASSEIIYKIPLYYPGGDVPKITAAWMDEDFGFGLNANIDLSLQSQQGDIYQPYILDAKNPKKPAINGIDKINTVEQISPEYLSKGYYTLIVKGESLKGNQLTCPLSIVMSGFLPYVTIDMDVANVQGNVGDLFKIGFVQEANPLDNKVQTVEFVKAILTNKKSGNNYELSKDSGLCLLGDVCFFKGLNEIGQYDAEVFVKIINTDGLVVESSQKFRRVYEVIGNFTMPTVDFDVPDLELVPGQFEPAYINIQAEDTDSNNYPQKFDLVLNYNGKEITLGGQELKCKGDFISKKIEINFPGTFYFTIKDKLNNRKLDSNKETLSYAFTVSDKKITLDFTQPDCEDNFKVLVKNPSPDVVDYEWTKFTSSGGTVAEKTIATELPLKNSEYVAVKVKENSKNNYFVISDQTFKKFLRYNDANGTNFKPTVEEYKQDPTVLLPGDFVFYYDTTSRKIISKSNKNYGLKFVGGSVVCSTMDQADLFDLSRDSNKNVLYTVKNVTTNSYLNITKEGTIEISSTEKKLMLSMGLKSTPSNSDKVDLPNSEIPAISLTESAAEFCPAKGTSSFTLTAQATDPSKQNVLQNLLSSNSNATVQFIKDGVVQQNSKSLTTTGTSSGIYQAVVTTGSCYKRSEADFVKSCNQEENESYDNTPKPGPGGGALVAIAGAAGATIAGSGQFVVGVLGGLFAIPSGFVSYTPSGNSLKTRFSTVKIEDNTNVLFTNSYTEYKDYDLGTTSQVSLTSGVDYYFSAAQSNNDGTTSFNKPKFFIDLNNDGILEASEDVLFKSVLVSGRYKFTLPTNFRVNASTKALLYASSNSAKQEIILKIQLEVKTRFTKVEVKEAAGTVLFTYNFPSPYNGYANYDISSAAPVAIYTAGQNYQFVPTQSNSDGSTSYGKPNFFVDLNGDGILQNSEDLLLSSNLVEGRYDFQIPSCCVGTGSVLAKYVAIAGSAKQEILFRVGLLKTRFNQITITDSSGSKIYDKRFVGFYGSYSDYDMMSKSSYTIFKSGETYTFSSTQTNSNGSSVFGKPKFYLDFNKDGNFTEDENVLKDAILRNGNYDFVINSKNTTGSYNAMYVAVSGKAQQKIKFNTNYKFVPNFSITISGNPKLCANDTQRYLVNITGDTTIGYKYIWYLNNIRQSTNSSDITFTGAVLNTGDTLKSIVFTDLDPATTKEVSLVIEKQTSPSNIVINGVRPFCSNDDNLSLTLNVTGGSGTFIYKWYKNGIKLVEGTDMSAFALIPMEWSNNDRIKASVSYQCTSGSWIETFSEEHTVVKNTSPSAVAVTGLRAFCNSDLISLSANITGGSGRFFYYWTKNGTRVSEGYGKSTYILEGNQWSNGDKLKLVVSYQCISGSWVETASQEYTVEKYTSPNSLAVNGLAPFLASDSLNLSLTQTGGTGSYYYYWTKNGTRVYEGYGRSTYTLQGSQWSNGDKLRVGIAYQCVAGNWIDILSPEYTIDERTAPTSVSFSGLGTLSGCETSYLVSANVVGGIGCDRLYYIWYKNGQRITEGFDKANYTVDNANWSNGDKLKLQVDYLTRIGGSWSNLYSQESTIVKNSSPSSIAISGLKPFCDSDGISLSANITGGSGRFYYYWTKNGTRVWEGYDKSTYTLQGSQWSNGDKLKMVVSYQCASGSWIETASQEYSVNKNIRPSNISVNGLRTLGTCESGLDLNVTTDGGNGSFYYVWLRNDIRIAEGYDKRNYRLNRSDWTNGDKLKVLVQVQCATGSFDGTITYDLPITISNIPNIPIVNKEIIELCSNEQTSVTVSGFDSGDQIRWYKNNVLTQETSKDFYLQSNSWNNGDMISAEFVRNNCVSPRKNITVYKNTSPSAVAVTGLRAFCNSDLLSLSANVTGGSGRFFYYWTKNGTRVSEGYDKSTYILEGNQWSNGDKLKLVVSYQCISGSWVETASQEYTVEKYTSPNSLAVNGLAPFLASDSLNLSLTQTGGTGSYYYYWTKNGTRVYEGYGRSTYTLQGSQWSNGDKLRVGIAYQCVAGNWIDILSPEYTIDERTAPTSVSFSGLGTLSGCETSYLVSANVVGGVGCDRLYYIWYKNGQRITEGFDKANYTVDNANWSNGDKLKLQVDYLTRIGGSWSNLYSQESTIVKNSSPSSIAISGLKPFCDSDGISLSANITGGSGRFYYYWTKNGTRVWEGYDKSTYTLQGNQWSNGDKLKMVVSYQCASGSWIETPSQEYTIVKNTSPNAVAVTGLRAFCDSDGISLSANVTGGSGRFFYYWTKNGTRVSEGYDKSNYTLQGNQWNNGDRLKLVVSYQCVSGSWIETASQEYSLDKYTSPSTVAIAGLRSLCNSEELSLTANLTGGTANFYYYWTKNDVRVHEGYGRSSYTLKGSEWSNGDKIRLVASYQCISGTWIETSSQSYVVEKNTSPNSVAISGLRVLYGSGDTSSLNASLTGGSGNYYYYWTKNGVRVYEGYGRSSYTLKGSEWANGDKIKLVASYQCVSGAWIETHSQEYTVQKREIPNLVYDYNYNWPGFHVFVWKYNNGEVVKGKDVSEVTWSWDQMGFADQNYSSTYYPGENDDIIESRSTFLMNCLFGKRGNVTSKLKMRDGRVYVIQIYIPCYGGDSPVTVASARLDQNRAVTTDDKCKVYPNYISQNEEVINLDCENYEDIKEVVLVNAIGQRLELKLDKVAKKIYLPSNMKNGMYYINIERAQSDNSVYKILVK
ncbi:S8 family peptidase [Flavobacterium columnare]|uniref:S8 family peptidase n=1 Tax=Flavobacterium columnare TaxID=996 RepID=UPI004033BD73